MHTPTILLRLVIAFLFALGGVATSMSAPADETALKRTLVVSSYHREYLWSQSTQDGLVNAMLDLGYLDTKTQGETPTRTDETQSSRAHVIKMWMDTKRRNSSAHIAQVTAAITRKVASFKPDLVLLGDDNAANYVGNRLLDSETPVVFWGINGLPLKYGLVDSMDQPGHNVTGVWLFDDAGNALLKPSDFAQGPNPAGFISGTDTRKHIVEPVDGGVVGIGRLSTTRHSPAMRLAVSVPSDAFSSELDPLFLVFAVTVVASALVFGIASIVASRGLTRPISLLREAASRFADGDFAVRSGSNSKGEIGELEESFDRMAENLQAAMRSRDRSLERLLEQSHEQERLIRARIEAEAAASASSEFLAHMSHELRTPLNSIIGFTDIMAKKMFGPLGHKKYDEYITDVSYSATHLLGLISDILDLSKIEAGQMEANNAPIDLTALLHECAVIVRPAARHDLAAITVSSEAHLPHLMGDSRMLRQVVINLFSNAIKFTPVSGRITLEASTTVDDGIELTVLDTGCGIPTDKLEHVLQPFGQVRTGSKTAHHSGTGLGLPLSRRLTELNGGELHIESIVDKGTKLRLKFPSDRVARRVEASNIVALPRPKKRA